MISRIGFAPFLDGLAIEQAQVHWRGVHAGVTLTMPGIRRYWQNHAVWADDMPLLPWAGFDACSEFDFDDAPGMDRCFSSDAYFTNVAPDEAQLVDKSRGGMLIAQRHRMQSGAPAPYRFMRFYRAAPLRPLAALGKVLSERPEQPGTSGREFYLALDGLEASQRVAAYDAVEIVAFPTAGDALSFALSARAREERRQLGGMVRGCDQLIARLVVVF